MRLHFAIGAPRMFGARPRTGAAVGEAERMNEPADERSEGARGRRRADCALRRRRRAGFLVAAALVVGARSAAAQQAMVAFDDPGEAAAAFFLLERHLDADATIDEMRGRYADEVLYYGRGLQDRARVLTDKSYYLRRWPERSVDPDLSTLTVEALPGGGYDVSIEIDFTLANDASAVSGRTEVDLTLEDGPNGLWITRENGRILSRR